jgi:ParB/RepB/Spo0J family partition protein
MTTPISNTYDVAKIHPNPWQPRQEMNDLQSLADDIKANGLLQIPTARPAPGKAGHVQLAFGHRRFAAWQIAFPGQEFPVELQELTDRQMSDIAAAENSARKDLTAIEKALAIKRRMADFKISQLDAGAPFGYKTQGAIANLLALLALPAPIQDCVSTGDLPERHARQLAKLAKAAPKDAEKLAKEIAKASPAERDVKMAEGLNEFIQRKGCDLDDAKFEITWPTEPITPGSEFGDSSVNVPAELVGETIQACNRCPYYYGRDHDQYCARPACFQYKNNLFARLEMDAAVKRLGIAAISGDEKGKEKDLPYEFSERIKSVTHLAQVAKQHGYLKLRLKVREYGRTWHADRLSGSNFIEVVTLNYGATERFFGAEDKQTKSKAGDVDDDAMPIDKQKQAEEKARAERARARSRRLRAIHDIRWLVLNAIEIASDQLAISGQVLTYVLEEKSRSNSSKDAEVLGLNTIDDEWTTSLKKIADGPEADHMRRKIFVLREICSNCILGTYNELGRQPSKAITEACKDIQRFVCEKTFNDSNGYYVRAETGFGAKLPGSWNRVPIHRTTYNCWTCGEFAGNTRLIKADQAAGWTSAADGRVTCPDCAKRPAPPVAPVATRAAAVENVRGNSAKKNHKGNSKK